MTHAPEDFDDIDQKYRAALLELAREELNDHLKRLDGRLNLLARGMVRLGELLDEHPSFCRESKMTRVFDQMDHLLHTLRQFNTAYSRASNGGGRR